MSDLIAIVGAGRMGRGIAHVFAYAGFGVALIDIKERPEAEARALLDEAAAEVARTVGLLQTFGLMDGALRDRILARVSYHALAEAPRPLAGASLAFEAVPEVLDMKQRAFGPCQSKLA